MDNPLARKLELFGPLSNDDRQLLDDIVAKSRSVAAHRDIIREGDAPSDVHLVLNGFVCRYKLLSNGRRSIFAYLLPGDFCDLHIFILKAMDHAIATLSPCRLVEIPRRRVLELLERPAIARALWWATLVDEATLREWLVNLGRRDAETGIAHLFCEIHLHLSSVGLVEDGELALPITQDELGDTMGLSTVHVNRSLLALRTEGLVTFKSGKLVIPDIGRLRAKCSFDLSYLHIDAASATSADLKRA